MQIKKHMSEPKRKIMRTITIETVSDKSIPGEKDSMAKSNKTKTI